MYGHPSQWLLVAAAVAAAGQGCTSVPFTEAQCARVGPTCNGAPLVKSDLPPLDGATRYEEGKLLK